MKQGQRPTQEYKNKLHTEATEMLNSGYTKSYVAEYLDIGRPFLNKLLEEFSRKEKE